MMNPVNWSNFDQSNLFTEPSENSFGPLFDDSGDMLKSLPMYQYNHEIIENQFNSGDIHFIHDQFKQQNNIFNFSTKNVQPPNVTKRHQKCISSESVDLKFTESSSVVTNGVRRRGPKKKPDSQERVIRMKMRRARANARERSRMHGLNSALDALRQHIPSALVSGHISFDHDKEELIQINTTVKNHNTSSSQQQNGKDRVSWKNQQSNNSGNEISSSYNNNITNLHQFGQKLSKIETLRLACNYIGLLASILNDIHFESITDIIKYLCHGLSQITTNQIAAALQSDPSRLMKHYTFGSDEKKSPTETIISPSSTSSTLETNKWMHYPKTDDNVNQMEKLQRSIMGSTLLGNKLTDKQIVNCSDCQEDISSFATPSSSCDKSVLNICHSMEICSSNCTEIIKPQNYLPNIKSCELENTYNYVLYDEMDEYALRLPYFPINYGVHTGDNQLCETNDVENWVSKTKLSLRDNHQKYFTPYSDLNNDNNNDQSLTVDSSQLDLNPSLDLKPYLYCYRESQYHDSNRMMDNPTDTATDNYGTDYDVTMKIVNADAKIGSH
ncbi:unnamed protein product [Heterobilharzia americana]|nr:unnamed protein product [Heterobilharzia americana]CAH8472361.1 unnamed protein product [Heterobilharzia americana]